MKLITAVKKKAESIVTGDEHVNFTKPNVSMIQ